MRSLSPLAAILLGVSACAAAQLGPDRDANIAGTNDVGSGDTDAGVIEISDAQTNDAGSADTGAPHQPLCDGVAHLRFAAAFIGGGQVARGSKVRIENGYRLLAVDGNCTYWIAAGWAEEAFSQDRPIRTGKLSDADVRVLEESLPIDDIVSLGSACDPNAGPLDAPARSIRAATGAAICGQFPADARFEAAWTAVKTVATKLASEGVPVDGPVHVSAVRAGVTGSVVSYPWPSGLPLDAFILDDREANMVGVSRLVNDPDATGQLRAVRDQYLVEKAAQPGLHPGDGLLATNLDLMVFVYMRDAIPYEDAQGLLAF